MRAQVLNRYSLLLFCSMALAPTAMATQNSSRAEKLYCEAPPVSTRGPSSVENAVAPNGVTVIQADSSLDLQPLAQQGYEIIGNEEFNNPSAWEEPSPKLRDYLLHDSGLERYLTGWDQLALDMLFLRAQEYPLKRLVAKYPKLPETRLDLLQKKISIAKQAAGGSGK
jgi:hypothetical protein